LNLKSQKGYSLLEVGVGLVIIVVFMYYSVTMLEATYNTYRYIEQNNMVMTYLVKSIENALLDDVEMKITDDPTQTVDHGNGKVVTTIPLSSGVGEEKPKIVITTTIEDLPPKGGKSYENSPVKKVTSTAEYYLRTADESSKRTMVLETLKIGGDEHGA
jgi:type II secretory pathway pseudopilin PulG